MIICLHKGKGIIGNLIKWQTRGEYSHASIMVNPYLLYESREFKGVQFSITPNEDIDYYYLPLSLGDENKIFQLIEKYHGAKYDYKMVARFMSRRGASSDTRDKFFCSELVFDILARSDLYLFNNTEGWEVCPSMLARSPLLEKIEYEKIVKNYSLCWSDLIIGKLRNLYKRTRETA
jgi:hypothetical protein